MGGGGGFLRGAHETYKPLEKTIFEAWLIPSAAANSVAIQSSLGANPNRSRQCVAIALMFIGRAQNMSFLPSRVKYVSCGDVCPTECQACELVNITGIQHLMTHIPAATALSSIGSPKSRRSWDRQVASSILQSPSRCRAHQLPAAVPPAARRHRQLLVPRSTR
jgi:hypothetical protein